MAAKVSAASAKAKTPKMTPKKRPKAKPKTNAKTNSKKSVKKSAKKPARKSAGKRASTPRKKAARRATSRPANQSARVKKAAPADQSGGYSDLSHWNKKRPAKASEQPLMKTLREEHRHMAGVMQLFSQQLDTIEAGEFIDPHLVYEIMDYMVTWPDRFHHPREDLIYGRVAELDDSAADDVDTLQRDHDHTGELGQAMLGDVEKWRQGTLSGEKLIKTGRKYIDHIYDHMNVEEKIVFPHIESVLSAADWRELEGEDQLKAMSVPVLGPKVQREFRNLARKLRRGVRRRVEQQAVEEWIDIEAFMESMEVVSMAYESSRHCAGEHLRGALKDAADIILDNPFSAPGKVVANNTRVTFDLLGDVANISRETLQDLVKVNRERRDRVRLLQRNSQRRSQ